MKCDLPLEGGGAVTACAACRRRTWLLARLGGHLEHSRSRIEAVLALSDDDLLAAVGGGSAVRCRNELDRFDLDALVAGEQAEGVEAVCCCQPEYPQRLRDLDAPPAVLHVAGGLSRALDVLAGDCVAIVGSRRASAYGLEVARALARDLATAGLTVVSGMALGIDAAAHAGALSSPGDGRTVAVLPASPAHSYPPSQRSLHRRIVASGVAVSELALGSAVWRWTFPARNRLIAALAAVTVVVEAGERSGSLVTATIAARLGRTVGAVPGRVTSAQAAGTNRLLSEGACVIRGAQDVLDAVYGVGARTVPAPVRPPLRPELERLLAALSDGCDTAQAVSRAGLEPAHGLAALAELELAGRVRRGRGGSYEVIP